MAEPERHQFFVDSEGRVHETSVFETVSRLAELFPIVEALSIEAELSLERAHRLLANNRDVQWAPYGLTGSRFVLLRSLYANPAKQLSMGQIASLMNLEPNNVTQLVDGLVREGLVERHAGEEDRRVIYARITPAGDDLFSRVMAETAERIAHAFSVLSPRERQTLSHLLTKVRMHLLADASLREEDHPSDRNLALKRRRRLKQLKEGPGGQPDSGH